MMSQLIYTLNLFTQLLVGVFIFHQVGIPKCSFLFTLVVWFAMFLGIHEVFLIAGTSAWEEVLQLLLKSLAQILVMALYQDSWSKRFLMIVMFMGTTILNEPLVIALVCLIFDAQITDFYSQNDMSVMLSSGKLLVVDLMLLTAVCICVFYKRRHRQNAMILKDLGLIFAFTGAHLVFLTAYFRLNRKTLTQGNILIQLVFQVLLFVMIFIQYFNSQRTRQLMHTEQELRTLQSRMETDYSYYKLADSKFTEISALRHDIQNQMQTVRTLLHNGSGTAQAENIIEQIQAHLDEVRTNYCRNRTINAVLTVKLGEEWMQGIRTEIVLHDCEDLPLDDYDLCSLVSNLFDNAVNACQRCDDPQDRFIELKSGIQEGYFLLRCTNSCRSAEELELPSDRAGHGYGKVIMERICRKYDGEFSLRYKDGNAVATAALRLKAVTTAQGV